MRILAFAFSLGLMCMGPFVSANAASAWYNCRVDMTGTASNGMVLIRLTDLAAEPEFSRKWFKVHPDVSKEFLATALSIITSDLRATVSVDTTNGEVPTLRRMFARR